MPLIRQRKPRDVAPIRVMAIGLSVNVVTSGRNARGLNIPLYELPLLRAVYALTRDTVSVIAEWDSEAQREVPLGEYDEPRGVRSWELEKQRLVKEYGGFIHGEQVVDLLTPIYGPMAERLATIIRAQHEAYRKLDVDDPTIDQLEALAALATPRDEGIEYHPPVEEATEELDVDPIAKEAIDGDLVVAFKARGLRAKTARELARVYVDGHEATDAEIIAVVGKDKLAQVHLALESLRQTVS